MACPQLAALALGVQLALAGLARAALFTDASQLPQSVYDFVVVGGMFHNLLADEEMLDRLL